MSYLNKKKHELFDCRSPPIDGTKFININIIDHCTYKILPLDGDKRTQPL